MHFKWKFLSLSLGHVHSTLKSYNHIRESNWRPVDNILDGTTVENKGKLILD